MRSWCIVTVLVAAGGLGCAKRYVLVQSKQQVLQGQAGQRDVRKTTTYANSIGSIHSVAFRLPETCLTQTAGAATGQATASNAIMTSTCAVWMAALERAVAREGYRVISWDALYRLERERGISTYVAAQQLGADMVFILNSLEANPIKGGLESELALTYIKSDPKGNDLGPEMLREDQRKVMRRFMEAKLNPSLRDQPTAVAATLDTTAILAKTGESIWFYRWGLTRPFGTSADLKVLFRGRESFWRPVLPDVPEMAVGPDQGAQSSTDVMVDSKRSQSADALQAITFDLVGFVANDSVTAFRAGGN